MSEFYNDGHVVVDETRYIVGNKTMPINSITSVEPTKKDYSDSYEGERIIEKAYTIPGRFEWLTLNVITTLSFIIACLVFYYSFSWVAVDFFSNLLLSVLYAFLGFILTAIIANIFIKKSKHIPAVKESVYKKVPSDYYVMISTASGESNSYTSTNKNAVLGIVEAINKAIIARG